jgi:DNA invertase Pin-like site-specific DNA recombinase
LSKLLESDVEIYFCDQPGATRMVLHIMAAIAEGEAKAIGDRTKAALAAAKAGESALGSEQPPGAATLTATRGNGARTLTRSKLAPHTATFSRRSAR